MIELDAAWRAANPLPALDREVDKKSRGRVLVVGGARRIPGAIRLTAEAALRAGAGRVRVATLESIAPLTGVLFPEIGVLGLPEDEGEIALSDPDILVGQAESHEAVVLGSGMADQKAAARLLECLSAEPPPGTALVADAAAVACAGPLTQSLRRWQGRLVLTPHEGEMASLAGRDVEEVRRDPVQIATELARRCDAVVVLKRAETLIVDPAGTILRFAGGGPGMATGGSGDVLAGVIGGLLSRGADPLVAAGWGVWLHGQAGRALAGKCAPLGFLARELLPELPALLPR